MPKLTQCESTPREQTTSQKKENFILVWYKETIGEVKDGQVSIMSRKEFFVDTTMS